MRWWIKRRPAVLDEGVMSAATTAAASRLPDGSACAVVVLRGDEFRVCTDGDMDAMRNATRNWIDETAETRGE